MERVDMDSVMIPLVEESEYRREIYGITHVSAFVYEVEGEGMRNIGYPHRLQVWDNTIRPNPRNGELVSFGPYGPIDGGDGRYLDPRGVATDAPVSFRFAPEAFAITSNGTNTGTKASGQVWARERLKPGQIVILRYPDGTQSDHLVVSLRYACGPELLSLS